MSLLNNSPANESEHAVVFDYPSWGLAEHTDPGATSISAVSATQHEAAMQIVCACADINLEGFCLVSEGVVKHYLGANQDPAHLVWLRFERADGKASGFMGEHVSVTVDLSAKRIVGFTHMRRDLTGDSFLSHQAAVTIAINFLKKAAPDLVPCSVAVPILKGSRLDGCKLDFEENPIPFGNVELHWVGDHTEELEIDGKICIVHGMKVKMYIPASGLWAWVIVDKHGSIETFERDIFWNFSEFRRETQLWLHDKWLVAHSVVPNTFHCTE